MLTSWNRCQRCLLGAHVCPLLKDTVHVGTYATSVWWYNNNLLIAFQDFIETLDEPKVRKVCTRILQNGVGSRDYIHGPFIMEDDWDNDGNAPQDGMSGASPGAEQMSLESPNPASGPSSVCALPWCKCGLCQVIPQEIENKCRRFCKPCLEPDLPGLSGRPVKGSLSWTVLDI